MTDNRDCMFERIEFQIRRISSRKIDTLRWHRAKIAATVKRIYTERERDALIKWAMFRILAHRDTCLLLIFARLCNLYLTSWRQHYSQTRWWFAISILFEQVAYWINVTATRMAEIFEKSEISKSTLFLRFYTPMINHK